MTINHFLSASKKGQEAYKKLIEMSRNDDYTTGDLFDFLCHQNYYKLGMDLSRQKNAGIPQKVNFTGKVEENDGAIIFFVANMILNFSLDSLTVTE